MPDRVPDQDRMEALDARLRTARKGAEPAPRQEHHVTQAQVAWRMVIELVTGMGIGFAAGWGLDAVFDTRPLFLVVLTLLGFAAGVRVMMRTADELQKQQAAKTAADKAPGKGQAKG